MKQKNTLEGLLQGSSDNHDQLFRGYLREAVRLALWDMMQEEVHDLCGPKYRPRPDAAHRRGGSDRGTIYLGGKRQNLLRPRVRHLDETGRDRGEVELRTYRTARRLRGIEADLVDFIGHGLSTRSFTRMKLDGMSRSEVSRRWVVASAQRLAELRERDLSTETFFGLIMDGVVLSRGVVVLVAIGLCTDGRKLVLDFEVGSSENYEVCRELLRRLDQRGFQAAGRLYVLIDGSPALEKAVEERWPNAVIQRCLVHKERNLHARLRDKDHAECSRLMDRIRQAEGAEAGREALQALKTFLAPRNQEALRSVEEAGERLITLHRLGAPSTLNRSLLSTNLIENVMLNYRRQTNRVSRWQTQTDQVSRWTAAALLWAEAGFRKITGYKDLPKLLTALGFPPDPLSGHPDSPARVAPGKACHAPCSHPPALKSKRFPAPFLPQEEVGGKNGEHAEPRLQPQPSLA